MKKCWQVRVEGQVQGVFFRSSAKTEAETLEIGGFIRNEPDGSVYIEVEGEVKILEKFVNWCKKGPPQAIIEKVSIKECQQKNYTKFVIENF